MVHLNQKVVTLTTFLDILEHILALQDSFLLGQAIQFADDAADGFATSGVNLLDVELFVEEGQELTAVDGEQSEDSDAVDQLLLQGPRLASEVRIGFQVVEHTSFDGVSGWIRLPAYFFPGRIRLIQCDH